MIINRIYETENLLSLWLVSFLVGLRTYQYLCIYAVLLSSRGASNNALSPFFFFNFPHAESSRTSRSVSALN
jgi:hypothetical protein